MSKLLKFITYLLVALTVFFCLRLGYSTLIFSATTLVIYFVVIHLATKSKTNRSISQFDYADFFVAGIVSFSLLSGFVRHEAVVEALTTIEIQPERKLATWLDNRTFHYQGTPSTSIEFISKNSGWSGAAVLEQLGCRFVYSYFLDDDKIELKFNKSDCGRSSINRTIHYRADEGCLLIRIEGEDYRFYPK